MNDAVGNVAWRHGDVAVDLMAPFAAKERGRLGGEPDGHGPPMAIVGGEAVGHHLGEVTGRRAARASGTTPSGRLQPVDSP